MENKIRKALDYYSYANSLKYIDCILLDGKRISYASDIFSKYSIAVANYLESKDDYSLGEVIRYLSIFDTLPAIRKLSKSEENLTVASDFTSPYSKKSAKAQEVFSESLCLNLRKPVDKKSKFVLSNKKLMFEPRTGHIYWGVSAPKLENTA